MLVLVFYCSSAKAAALPLFTTATNTIESGNAVAIDSVNQWVYVVGRFTTNTAFPGISSSAMNGGIGNGKMDGFLAKLNFTGTLLWVVNFGNDEDDEGVDVAVGPDNNIYLTGYAQRNPVFHSTSGATAVLNIANGDKEDIFLASYDPNGILRWTKRSGGNERDKGLGITVDATGVYNCGVYEENDAEIGGIDVNPTYDDLNTYLWKTDFLGNTLWMIEAKSNNNDYDNGKSVQELKMGVHAQNGKVYVVGYMGGSGLRFTNTSGSLLSSPILNNADGQPDVFVYSANPTGTINWARNFSNNSNNIRGYSITADCEAVYVAGSIHDNALFPGGVVSVGEHDFPFIASLDPATGIDNWVVTLSGATNHEDVIYDITADLRGYIYVTGTFRSNPFHGPDTTLAGAADNEVFVSKFRRDGDFVWAKNTTNVGNSFGYGVAVYRNDRVFVTGEYSQNLNFGSVSTTSSFTQNMFVSFFNAGDHVYNSCCIVPSVGGTASVTPSVFCPGSTLNLSLTGYTGSIQWQVSTDGGSTWNSIAGATAASYNYTPATGNVRFRAAVTGVGCVPANSTVAIAQYETVAPVISGCPSNMIVNNDPGLCTKTVTWTAPTVSDNCPGATIAQTSGLPSGSAFPKGTTTVTYTATDAAGNTSTCSFTVTVNDNQNPVISGCPSNMIVNNDPGLCTKTVSWPAPAVSDNCPGATITQTAGLPSGSAFPKGTTAVTYTATDAAGNTSICSFTVTVNDNQNPVISGCPSDMVVNNDPGVCTRTVSWTAPTVSDNCPGATITQTSGLPSGSAFPKGTTTVTYTATDAAGNTAICSFTITVNDHENPVISGCPSNMVVNNDPGVCTKTVTWTAPTVSDNCPGATIAQTAGLPSGSAFPKGTTTVTYTATDAVGNTSACSFTVTVNDNEDPQLSGCPSNFTVNTMPGMCSSAPVTWATPGFTDNCPGAAIAQTAGLPSGSSFPKGTTAVTYTATDAAGNTSSCSFTVTVNDSQDPVITGCPSNINTSTEPGMCTAHVSWITPLVTDNCAGSSITQISGLPSGSAFPTGITSIVYVATDADGNTDTCGFSVTVTDEELPVFTSCPSNIVVSSDPGICSANVSWVNPLSTDNCSMASMVQTAGFPSGSSFPLGTTLVSYTATDVTGNMSTCSFNVTVNDTEAPVITVCPGDITSCDSLVSYLDVAGTDNCSVLSILQTDGSGYTSGSTFPVGTTPQQYTLTDLSGNVSTCSFNVKVLPVIQPQLNNVPDTFCRFAPLFDLSLCETLNPGETSYFYGSPGVHIDGLYLFAPALSTVGDHQIFHIVTNGTCADTGVVDVTVLKDFESLWSASDTLCAASGALWLDSLLDVSADPGGTWLVNGIVSFMIPDLLPYADDSLEITYWVGTAGCNDTTTHMCWVAPVADPSWAFGSDTICSAEDPIDLPALVTGTPGGSWSGPGVIGNALHPAALSGTQNIVYTAGVEGCTETSSHDLYIYAQPVIDAGPDQQVCGHNCELQASASTGNVSWAGPAEVSVADPAGLGTAVTVNAQGNYWMYLQVSNGLCQVHDSVQLVFSEPPVAHAGEDQYLDFIHTTTLSADLPEYGVGQWIAASENIVFANASDSSTQVFNLVPGDNLFFWTVTNGSCPEVRDEVVVHVKELFIPTGFSPNGDGINDIFEIRNIGEFDNKLQVFNRWGQVVYEAGQYNNTWDGKNGTNDQLPDDTYYYTLEIKDMGVFTGYVIIKKQ